MVAIPLLSGVSSSETADFNIDYPVNLEPVPLKNGISEGYLRSTAGAEHFADGPGIDRGGINWNESLYRVMGTKLVQVTALGAVTVLGDVGGDGPVAVDYGFDRLAIGSGGNLFYWDGTSLTQVTDTDLGTVQDMLWMTGYYVTTDGTYIIVTDLSDPTAVNPLKYGSAEEDPDMVVGLFKLHAQLYAIGRYTIQPFDNVGGSLFPFAAIPTATIPVGAVGPHAKCAFYQTLAFTGSGRDEGLAVYLLDGGNALKISTRAIDDELAKVVDPAAITMESRMSRDERRLLIHLPDKTLVYMANATRISGQPVWYIAASGLAMDQQYRLQNAVLCYGKWICGDTANPVLGVLDEAVATQFGDAVGWRFDTILLWNQTAGAIVHQLELSGLPGRGGTGRATAFLSTSRDGETWSGERPCGIGRPGERIKRMQFQPHKRIRNYLGIRFRGNSDALAGFAGLDATIEALR